jgi:biotin carboxyl carrier protein
MKMEVRVVAAASGAIAISVVKGQIVSAGQRLGTISA